jgi:hypothetical protein
VIRKRPSCGAPRAPGAASQLPKRLTLRKASRGRTDLDRQGRTRIWVAEHARAIAPPDSMYMACRKLFADYPLAVRSENCSETVRSMVLMQREKVNSAKFFVLMHDCSRGTPFYSLYQWPASGVEEFDAEGSAVAPEAVMNVVSRAVPIPRHGSMFGWREEDIVTALIVFYADNKPPFLEPSWTVMPLAGIVEARWPAFTDQSLFGPWFWEHSRAGRIVCLANLIARTSDTVFWVSTEAFMGSDCCAVARDIPSPEGYRLRRGCYVYFEVLRAGGPVPSLRVLLSGSDKIDLAPRFRWPGQTVRI